MQFVKLGRSGVEVSRICMGCMGFGDAGAGSHAWTLDYERSREIIKRGLELGVTFFDTAIAYQNGTSEQYVGRALRELTRRDAVAVATKFLPRTEEEIAAGVSGQRHVERMLDASLKNLGMDYVDLYICHMWDYNTPVEEILEGMNNTVKAGKARSLGISNCYAWQLAKVNALAERNGWARIDSVQGHYNLLFREEEREMVPLCKTDTIALTPYSALAAGRLARRPGETATKRLETDAVAKMKYDATAQQDECVIARVAELADRYGVPMSQVVLAWLLAKVDAPVVGATKLHHVEDAVAALDLTLSAAAVAYLEEPYVPHKLVGVMAFNRPKTEDGAPAWLTGRKG